MTRANLAMSALLGAVVIIGIGVGVDERAGWPSWHANAFPDTPETRAAWVRAEAARKREQDINDAWKRELDQARCPLPPPGLPMECPPHGASKPAPVARPPVKGEWDI